MLVRLRAAPSSGPGTPWRQGVGMDDEDELAMWVALVAKCIVAMLALVGVAGLAGYVWGML